jgi:hypothetical protein
VPIAHIVEKTGKLSIRLSNYVVDGGGKKILIVKWQQGLSNLVLNI